YDRLGFVPWIDFRLGRTGYDPLWSYYRWQNRDNRLWERNLVTLYAGRRSGDIARPPVSLTQQAEVVQNLTTSKTTNTVTNIRNVTFLAPLAQVDKTVVKLQRIPETQLAEERRAVQHFRDVSQHRQKLEAQVLAAGAPTRPTDAPKEV